jgi:antitoxin (DNA-binding transcriptional repressor) of toxin-antitoxin stability system
METISVSNLKAHLSGELKKVKAGSTLIVLEHKHPVAMVIPFDKEPLLIKEAEIPYRYRKLTALTEKDPLEALLQEREERW